MERAERTRERIERELKDAVGAEARARKDEDASEAAHRKAAAERERLPYGRREVPADAPPVPTRAEGRP